MVKKKINVRGTLTQMKKRDCFLFPTEVNLRYLRNTCSELKDSGFIFSVNKADNGYKVTRTK